MDSIHCYSRLEGDISSTDDMETTCDVLDPPVVIVGTWKDALTSESDEKIRQNILKVARSMRTWNTDYPLKFIQLEQCLQEKKKELPIIPFKKLEHIAEKTPMPLNGEELILYLKYHHKIKALVYFEDLPDHIILDTQWLSNAFKCIVTARPFRNESIRNQKRWEEFSSRGKLHSVVLERYIKRKTKPFVQTQQGPYPKINGEI
ncbi:unnamed protein product [Mytilus edulis]|uniref:COR domain-containing protein n=1 Tax=Mytilus edulis TaxID=6550 RepID=A0A8S3UEH6_MYTED|nr:unnamed protein product [Mytilus edulis]